MVLTAHKTVARLMRYVHTDDDAMRHVAEWVASRRQLVVATCQEPNEVAP